MKKSSLLYLSTVKQSCYNNSMKANNLYLLKDSATTFRQTLSILSSELIRNSLSAGTSRPNVSRDSVSLRGKGRRTMNVELLEHIRREFEGIQKQKEKNKFSHLKSTLSELQKKISKAKRQLKTYKNIISEESEEENDRPTKTPSAEEITTVASSQSKLHPFHSEPEILSAPQQLKTYYLCHVVAALQGNDPRALEHLSLSLKVLSNYYKIPSPSYAQLEGRKVCLPKAREDMYKKTLVLDIDETIIHCEEEPSLTYDMALPIKVESGSTAQAYISIRPYVITFLKRISKHYQIIAFTASHESYADVVLDELDPERQYIKHRLYRRNCVEIHQNVFTKDLRIINRDLSSMILVDNAPYSYLFQLENAIPLLPYYSGSDQELLQLQKYLFQLAKCADVRQINKQTFQLHKYCHFSDLYNLANDLYLPST